MNKPDQYITIAYLLRKLHKLAAQGKGKMKICTYNSEYDLWETCKSIKEVKNPDGSEVFLGLDISK